MKRIISENVNYKQNGWYRLFFFLLIISIITVIATWLLDSYKCDIPHYNPMNNLQSVLGSHNSNDDVTPISQFLYDCISFLPVVCLFICGLIGIFSLICFVRSIFKHNDHIIFVSVMTILVCIFGILYGYVAYFVHIAGGGNEVR